MCQLGIHHAAHGGGIQPPAFTQRQGDVVKHGQAAKQRTKLKQHAKPLTQSPLGSKVTGIQGLPPQPDVAFLRGGQSHQMP